LQKEGGGGHSGRTDAQQERFSNPCTKGDTERTCKPGQRVDKQRILREGASDYRREKIKKLNTTKLRMRRKKGK